MAHQIVDSERYEFSIKMNIFFNFMELLKKTNQKYLIYGYGTVGKTIGAMLQEKVVGFLDKNENVVMEANQNNIALIQKIDCFMWDKIIISVLGREEEIRRELQNDYGVLGDNILVIPLGKEFYSELYQKVYVNASYSPWCSDQNFLTIYHQIQNNTLVDIFRCYEIFTLVEQASKLQKGALIEIGVFKGGTGAIIASQAQTCGIPEKVYLCDTFQGVVKASEVDTFYINGEHTASEATAKELLEKMHLDNVVLLKGVFPDETACLIEDQIFRFCHIDVDVYQSAKDIMNWIWPKMLIGGIVVYDDFGFHSCEGVRKHVEEQKGLADRLVVHNLNGHAIVVKIH